MEVQRGRDVHQLTQSAMAELAQNSRLLSWNSVPQCEGSFLGGVYVFTHLL